MRLTLPGLVDLQVNGFAGVDFNAGNLEGEDIDRALNAMCLTGVRACLPTIITSSTPHFAACATPLVASSHQLMVGIHMEGPYISAVDGPRGAHDIRHVAPASVEDFKRRQDAAEGQIQMVTLAPEVPGALALIEYLVGQNIVVALGHMAADAETIAAAASAGATLSTHLGNGCFNQMDRHQNVFWPQLANDRLAAGLIVDGHHLPPDFVATAVKAKTPARCILVTDAVAAAAAPPGRYGLADFEVERAINGRVTAVGAGHLAGSSLTLDDAIGRTCDWCDLDLETVWSMASLQPAAAIGIPPPPDILVEWDEAEHRVTVINDAA